MALTSAQAEIRLVPVLGKGFQSKVRSQVRGVKAPDINVGVQLDRQRLR